MSTVIRRAVLLALTLATGLAGCAIGPDYTRPALTPPEQFRGPSAAETSSLADLPWWEVFGDPTLTALIQEALAGNYDLRIAAERVQQARAQSMIARAVFFPAIGYTANAQRSKGFEAFLGISNDHIDSSGQNLFVGALRRRGRSTSGARSGAATRQPSPSSSPPRRDGAPCCCRS